MAAVFYHSEEQKRLAVETRGAIERTTGSKVQTKIFPYTGFYPAEDYHQKHYLQRYPELMEEFRAMYPTAEGLVSSTAVARVNGYLGGYGECDDLNNEAQGLGLSPEGLNTLSIIVCGRKGAASCPVPK